MIVGLNSAGAVGGTVVSAGVPPIVSTAPDTAGAASNSTSTLIHSPHVIQDPSAGFITEYLSANGSQIISQTPSAVTVAYLRVGLTADGLHKKADANTQTAA